MANATQLFKDDEEEKLGKGYTPDDKELGHLTGITPGEEADYEKRANDESEDEDGGSLAEREQQAGESGGAEPKGGKAAETAAGLGAAETAKEGLYNAVDPGGIRKLGKFFWGSKARKRSTVGGGVGVLVIGASFFGLSVVSGPFQFVHLAQLMQQFHLQEQSDETDDRASKLTRFYRYAKSGGKVEQTRLGVFANTYASQIEKQLNRSGIESGYDPITGKFTGYVIDRENAAFKGKSVTEIEQYFKDTYGITVSSTEVKGKLTINMEKTSYLSQRKLIGSMMQEAGYKGVSGAIRARIMGKRAGITWHPLKNVDTKYRQKIADLYKAVKENRDTNLQNGAPEEAVITEDKAQNDPTKTQAQNDATQASASDTQAGATQATDAAKVAANGDPSALKGIVGKAGGAAAFIGLACVVKGLADRADQIKYTQVALPMMRMGMEAVSLGGQVMYGGQTNPDFTKELGYYQQFLTSTSKDNPGSWTGAKSIQAELGQKETGVEADSTARSVSSGNPLSFMEVGILGTALSGVCNSVVQGALTVVGFLGGPFSAAAGFAFSTAVSASGALETIASWVAGKAINYDTASGPQYGNYVNYGVRLAANDEAIAAGGRQLTTVETAQLNGMQKTEATIAFENHSLGYRLFSMNDSRSLLGTLIDAQNTKVSANVSQTATGILHLTGSLLSIPSKLFASVGATPDTSYNYGFPQFGFSATELNDPDLANPYANADYVLNNGLLTTYGARAESCFNVTIDASGNVQSTGSEQGTNFNPYAQTYSGDCADTGKDWLRVRMYIFDSETADSLSCYQGDDAACSNVGFGAQAAAVTSGGNDGAVTDNTTYTFKAVTAADVQKALARAAKYVANNSLVCGSTCHNKCDHIVAEDYGYSASGYFTAADHWQDMINRGYAHPKDTSVPIGALMFWDTGTSGHVALYVGGGMVATNDHPDGTYSYAKVSDINKWGPYLGWSEPVFKVGAPRDPTW